MAENKPSTNVAALDFVSKCAQAGIPVTTVYDWGKFAFNTRYPDKEYTTEYEEWFDTLNKTEKFPYRISDNGLATAGILNADGNIFDYFLGERKPVTLVPEEPTMLPNGGVAYAWVSVDSPIALHLARTALTNEYYLCVNGMPVFLLNFTSRDDLPTETLLPSPQVIIRTDGEQFKLEESSMQENAYETTDWGTLANNLVDAEWCRQYCLGSPVTVGDTWMATKPENVISFEDVTASNAVEWFIRNVNPDEIPIISYLCMNKTATEGMLREVIDATLVDNDIDASIANEILGLRKETPFSEEFITFLLTDERISSSSESFWNALGQPNVPLRLVFEQEDIFEKWNRSNHNLEEKLAECPESVERYLTEELNVKFEVAFPGTVLASMLITALGLNKETVL